MQITSADMIERIGKRTMIDVLADTVAERRNVPALNFKASDGSWNRLTWAEYLDAAASVASSLRKRGISRGDRVALLMRNRLECNIADIACMLLGVTTTSIYLTSANSQLEWILGHSEAVAILVDGEQLERTLQIKPQLPNLNTVICVDEVPGTDSSVIAWADLLNEDALSLDEARGLVQQDDIATIIYTSGTTGRPKAAQHSHRSIVSGVESIHLAFGEGFTNKRVISYLPMAHVAERFFSHYVGLRLGSEVYFCPEVTAVGFYLLEVKPNIFFGPPRIWEKLWAAAQGMARSTPDPVGAEMRRALEVGLQAARARTATGEIPGDLEIDLAETAQARMQITSALALDTIEIALTAAASISADTLDGMASLGVELSDSYGMTEFVGGVGSPYDPRRGCLGRPFPGVDMRIAEDGEVQLRGPQAFVGYLKDPDQTAASFTEDGWVKSGDLGVIEEDGYLRLIGRKKDLIITAGGKNISPGPIESAIASSPLVSNAVVVGEARKFPAALVLPDPIEVVEWGKRLEKDVSDVFSLMADPDLEQEILKHIEQINKGLARVEQIKRIKILPEVWGPDSDVMTPTMKIKRNVVAEKYAADIDGLYADEA